MSTGTHRRRCRKETRKEKSILITAAVSQLSTVSGSVMSPTQVHSHCFRSVHTSSQVICLLFFCPPTLPKTRTTVRTTPLYGKWSGNKHRILVIPPLWFLAPLVPFSHSDICCLHTRCMTFLPLESPCKNRMFKTFTSFPSQMW